MSFHCKHRALRLWVLASFVLALLVGQGLFRPDADYTGPHAVPYTPVEAR